MPLFAWLSLFFVLVFPLILWIICVLTDDDTKFHSFIRVFSIYYCISLVVVLFLFSIFSSSNRDDEEIYFDDSSDAYYSDYFD